MPRVVVSFAASALRDLEEIKVCAEARKWLGLK
jgi:hypothetical protein